MMRAVAAGVLAWARANPVLARLAVKFAVVLPLGLAAGLLLGWLCDALDVSQNLAAFGAVAVALGGGLLMARRVAAALGIPEPEP